MEVEIHCGPCRDIDPVQLLLQHVHTGRLLLTKNIIVLFKKLSMVMSGSTSRELKDALEIQGGGLEQHWGVRGLVSWT